MSRAIGVFALGLIVGSTAAPAWAGNGPFIENGAALEMGPAMEVGGIVQSGVGEFASTVTDIAPNAQGLVLRDRNGLTARTVFGILITVASAPAQNGPKSVESKSYREGDYLVTETKTTYYSEAEKAEMRANANEAIDGLFASTNAEFELQVYSRDRWGYGDSSGHKATFLVGNGDADLVFEAGLGWGDVNSIVHQDGETYALDHKYLGIPFRLSGSFRPLRWALTWEWNWLAHGIDDVDRHPTADPMDPDVERIQVGYHPLHLDLEGAFFGRLFVTGGATVPSVKHIRSGDVGYRASIGLRF
jgi:hypothetical protein